MPKNSRRTTKEEDQRFHVELAKQMMTLATAAFGLVAALAWNGFIQEFFATYVKRWFDVGGKLLSMAIYAIVVTVLAVIVTWQLSKLVKKIEDRG